jgi:uncharacterized protein (DUF433 family)
MLRLGAYRGERHMSGTIDAFTMDQAAKLSGLSEDQLRSWDTAGLFRPSLGWEDRRRHYSRIYTFEDLVALRTLARLREEGVSTRKLKQIGAYLKSLTEQPWVARSFFVVPETGKVFFTYEDALLAAEPMGQQAMSEIVALGPVEQDVRDRLAQMRARVEQRGRIVTDRYIHGGAPIFAGTRIPVSTVIEFLGEGHSADEIIAQFPRLTCADIEAARALVAA